MRYVKNLDELDDIKLNKLEITIHKNFKLPIFLAAIILFIFSFYKLYNATFMKLFSNINISMIFFSITLFLSFFISLRVVLDILSIVFGQKGQHTLSEKANQG